MTTALAAVLGGFGITRVISYMVAHDLAAGRLKTILATCETAPVPIHVIHHEGRRATRKLRAFLDLAIETLRSDGALN